MDTRDRLVRAELAAAEALARILDRLAIHTIETAGRWLDWRHPGR